MYRNEFEVAAYQEWSTAGQVKGGGVDTAMGLHKVGDHNQLYMFVAVQTAYPSYSDRGPDLNITIEIPSTKLNVQGAPGVTATTLPVLDLGLTPSTSKAWVFDVTEFALGWMNVNHWLSVGGGSTARATYAITLVGKGYH